MNSLFKTQRGLLVPATDATNEAGGNAYACSPQEALAQFAATGCFNSTYYVDAETQLTDILKLAAQNTPEFVAQTAIYSREQGRMKDMPAFLCASLAFRDQKLCAHVFAQVIDNARMLRNFVQVIRSGVFGKKSFPQFARKLIRKWLADKSDTALFHASIGNSPSLADIIKMVHPKARNIYAYLLGKLHNQELLPPVVKAFEKFKQDKLEVPDINFQFLSALTLSKEQWQQVARSASWQTLRMNLNTFHRHGCFDDRQLVQQVCGRLMDEKEVKQSGVLPYQLFTAYLNVADDLPPGIKMSLANATEIACQNVPTFDGQLVIALDVSSSMSSPITGCRKGATSKMTCVQVAALIACALVRKNPTAMVIPFDTRGFIGNGFARGSIVDSAATLAQFGGGGTDCHIPLAYLNQQKTHVDAVIYVSDYESWVDAQSAYRGTATMQEWRVLQSRCPKAKMVCIDLTPNKTTQQPASREIANVGGFSDAVFDFVRQFLSESRPWTELISSIALPA